MIQIAAVDGASTRSCISCSVAEKKRHSASERNEANKGVDERYHPVNFEALW
jgi:hypothetical protein